MRRCGLYHDDDCIKVECLKFCFMLMLRDELHRAAKLWILHRIRPSKKDMESPSGGPDVLLFLPKCRAQGITWRMPTWTNWIL